MSGTSKYIRRAKVELSVISNAIKEELHYIMLGGYSIKLTSIRMQQLHKSKICSVCGIEGTFWGVESHWDTPDIAHTNLYAVSVNGSDVLMCKARVLNEAKEVSYVTKCTQCLSKK